MKNAKIVQLWVYPKFLTLISRADWSDKSECYYRTVHCFQNIWFNKRMHPNEHRNGYWLSTKWVLASDQSSVKSWLVQPIMELSSVAGLCAGRGCALIRQLANCHQQNWKTTDQKLRQLGMNMYHGEPRKWLNCENLVNYKKTFFNSWSLMCGYAINAANDAEGVVNHK